MTWYLFVGVDRSFLKGLYTINGLHYIDVPNTIINQESVVVDYLSASVLANI